MTTANFVEQVLLVWVVVEVMVLLDCSCMISLHEGRLGHVKLSAPKPPYAARSILILSNFKSLVFCKATKEMKLGSFKLTILGYDLCEEFKI